MGEVQTNEGTKVTKRNNFKTFAGDIVKVRVDESGNNRQSYRTWIVCTMHLSRSITCKSNLN